MSNILIVEDEEITAFALELFCQKLGYTVLDTINNYDDALMVIKKERPDLILTDIQLSGQKSGLDIALIAQKEYGISSVFLTAYYNEEILKQAKNIEFHGYIIKPYKENELEATLKLALYQIAKKRNSKQRYIDFCNHIFDMKTLTLYNNDNEIPLSKKSKRLFYFLALHTGEIKSYSEIIDYVYEGESISLDTLRHLVKRTRELTHKECIIAARNIGYSLAKKSV